MIIAEMTCSSCGAHLQVDAGARQAKCGYCGATVLIDDGVRHVQYDNAEQAGYEFEKGRQRAQAEANAYAQQYYAPQYQQPVKKKRHTFWWVMGWIFIYPLPLTIIVCRSKRILFLFKVIIIAAAWLMYPVLVLGLASYDSTSYGSFAFVSSCLSRLIF